MVKNIAQYYHLNVVQWHHRAQSQHLNSSLFFQVNIQQWLSIKNQYDKLIELIIHRSTQSKSKTDFKSLISFKTQKQLNGMPRNNTHWLTPCTHSPPSRYFKGCMVLAQVLLIKVQPIHCLLEGCSDWVGASTVQAEPIRSLIQCESEHM